MVSTTFLNHEDRHIERIYFDPTFWEGLKKKLLDFYLYAMLPELLTSRVKRGIPTGKNPKFPSTISVGFYLDFTISKLA